MALFCAAPRRDSFFFLKGSFLGELRTLNHAIYFTEECILQRVILKPSANRIARSPVKLSLLIEKAVLQDERQSKIEKYYFPVTPISTNMGI